MPRRRRGVSRNVIRYLTIIGFYALENHLGDIVELYQDLGEVLRDYAQSREEEDWDDLSDVVIQILEAGSDQIAYDRGLQEVSAFVQMADDIADEGLSTRVAPDLARLLRDELEVLAQQEVQRQQPVRQQFQLPPPRRIPAGRALAKPRRVPRGRTLPPPRRLPPPRQLPSQQRVERRQRRAQRQAAPPRRRAPRRITFLELPSSYRRQLRGEPAPFSVIAELRQMPGFAGLPGLYRNTSVGHVILDRDPNTGRYGVFISRRQ